MLRVAVCLATTLLLLGLGSVGAIWPAAEKTPPDDCGVAAVSRMLIRNRPSELFSRLETEYELATILAEEVVFHERGCRDPDPEQR